MRRDKRIIGKIPVCNRKSDRAPHFFGFCFIFCYRCSGVLLGILLGYIIHQFNISLEPNLGLFLFGGLLMTFLVVDGTMQYFKDIESTNMRRLVSGLMAGLGIYICVLNLVG